jgi:hypothetical protein
MQVSRIGMGFGLAMLLATAVFPQKVTTAYSKVQTSAGQTFMWIKEPKTTNPLMPRRIIDDVNSPLGAKGLRLVTTGADLAVAAHAATKEEHTLQPFYDGFGGGWRWGGGFGSATTTVNA